MTDTRLHRVKEIFFSVADLPPGERAAALDRACGDNATLRDKITRMLATERGESGFLDEPALIVGEDLLPDELRAPERVGPYRVRELLGEGGFGSVYRAEQQEPIRREVALKIIKPGMGTRGVMARFEAERQTLALLDHPGIARVYDAGATDAGQPYFVMELIPGEPITRYCDRQKHPISARLGLFIDICHAVQHAHQKGVIHRDLKPSNVLVRMVGDKPAIKVIDFGIAKAIDEPGDGGTLLTLHGQMVGTPDYMSPEQADPSRGDADTRSDIYALGVLLYKLLTGVTPLRIAQDKRPSPEGITRAICERDPARPSASLAAMGGALSDTAISRSADTRRLVGLVRGDLDWIALKALEKDPERRYQTAAGLADDLARFLRSEPVSASPPSRAYRVRKFARRNRGLVAGGTLLSVVVLAGLVATTTGFVFASRERDDKDAALLDLAEALANETDAKASAERSLEDEQAALAEAEAVQDFLIEMLSAANPWDHGRDMTVRMVVDEAAQGIGEAFADRPLLEIRIRSVLGETYRGLGELALAQEQFQAALAAARSVLGAEDARTLACAEALVRNYGEQGLMAEAEDLCKETLDAQRRLLGDEDLGTLNTMNSLALLYQRQGKYDQAEALSLEGLQIRRRLFGEDAPETTGAMNNLAFLYIESGQPDKAEPLLDAAVSIQKRTLGEDHPVTITALNTLGYFYRTVGRFDQSAEVLAGALAGARGRVGDAHPLTVGTMHSLAQTDVELGRYERAAELMTTALATEPPVWPADSWKTGHLHLVRAEARMGLHESLAAEADLLEACEILGAAVGDEHPFTQQAIGDLVELYEQTGRNEDAAAWREKLLDEPGG